MLKSRRLATKSQFKPLSFSELAELPVSFWVAASRKAAAFKVVSGSPRWFHPMFVHWRTGVVCVCVCVGGTGNCEHDELSPVHPLLAPVSATAVPFRSLGVF